MLLVLLSMTISAASLYVSTAKANKEKINAVWSRMSYYYLLDLNQGEAEVNNSDSFKDLKARFWISWINWLRRRLFITYLMVKWNYLVGMEFLWACHESTIVFWADVLKRLKAGVYWNIRLMLSIYVTTVGFECMTSAAYVHVSAANEDKRKVNAAKVVTTVASIGIKGKFILFLLKAVSYYRLLDLNQGEAEVNNSDSFKDLKARFLDFLD
ncbi:hypothetical protein Tco_0307451 [Tanacetum coccineum]